MDSYAPKIYEKSSYEELWKLAAGDDEHLGGEKAVTFFKSSGLDTGSLKAIWTWSSPDPVMTKNQFFTALRYVALVQSGENLSRAQMAVKLAAYEKWIDKALPAPWFQGVTLRHATAAHHAPVPYHNSSSVSTISTSGVSRTRSELISVDASSMAGLMRTSSSAAMVQPRAAIQGPGNSRGPPPAYDVATSLPTTHAPNTRAFPPTIAEPLQSSFPRSPQDAIQGHNTLPRHAEHMEIHSLNYTHGLDISMAVRSGPDHPINRIQPPVVTPPPPQSRATAGARVMINTVSSVPSSPPAPRSPAATSDRSCFFDSNGELFIPCSYIPRHRAEQQTFDSWWHSLNPSGQSYIGGPPAVAFFKRSGLDVGTLQTIWKLSSPDDKLDQMQFYVSLRFIAIAQQSPPHDFPSILTPEYFSMTIGTDFGLPNFAMSPTGGTVQPSTLPPPPRPSYVRPQNAAIAAKPPSPPSQSPDNEQRALLRGNGSRFHQSPSLYPPVPAVVIDHTSPANDGHDGADNVHLLQELRRLSVSPTPSAIPGLLAARSRSRSPAPQQFPMPSQAGIRTSAPYHAPPSAQSTSRSPVPVPQQTVSVHPSARPTASPQPPAQAPPKAVKEEELLECVICMMEFSRENRMASTQCACGLNMALFHKPCLKQWLAKKTTCPICDSKLVVLEPL